jgi:membrane protease subunit (stomatin/prohibitin family)
VEADLIYLRTGPTPRLRWGTATAISVAIAGHGVVPIRAFGRFTTRFRDPAEICKRFLRQGIPSDDDVEQRLRRIVAGRFAQALSGLPEMRLELLNDLDTLCARVREQMDGPLRASGLHLSRFDIENLTGPLELGLRPMSKRTQNLSKIARQVVQTRPSGLAPTEELIACHSCGLHIPAMARFCSGCGAPNRKTCAKCGTALPIAARFCSGCGAPQ